MNDKKQIIYVLTLQISKITLRVRFPCTVCTTIKIDGNQREITGESELRNGQALLNISHHTQIPLPAKKEHLTLDKKCTLLIYLKSSSGRIPAGSVPLPLLKAEARTIREISRIDKCPDKNAFIEFEMKLEKIEEKKDVTTTTTLQKEYRRINNEYSQKIIKLTKAQSPQKNIQDKNKSLNQLVGSQIEQKSVKDTILLRRMASKREEIQRSSLFQTYYSGQRKINDGEKIFALQREMESYKTKLMILESEIANKNQRNSQNEKEIKQLQKKNEQLEMELKSTISKMDYADRFNKDLTNQIKQLKEKCEQQKLNHQNAIKRWQIRQNSYKQQIKIISDKLYGSENQKQRMVYQKNISSNEFQGRQKKLRESFKEKEKKMLEERTLQLKKIDSLEKDIQKLKDEIGQSKSKNADNIQQVHELKIIVENVQSQKQRFRNQCNDLRFELTKLKNQKHILQENLDSIGKFNEQRRNFRKQLSDRDIEISQLKDKIISSESQISRLRNQNQESDKIFKQKCNYLKTLQRDYNIIIKENAILVGDISNKQSKITSLIEQLQMQMKRSKYLQGSAVQLQQQFQSKQDALERELRQSTSYRNILQQEVDKLNQQLENAHQQISSSLKEIQELQQMLQQKNQWIASLQSQMIQLNNLNQQWQMEKIELAQEKRQLQEKYMQLSQESQEHQKQLNGRILTISQKWQENASQLEGSLAENNEKIKILKDMLKEKEDHLTSMIQLNSQLQKQIDLSIQQRQKDIAQQTDLNSKINSLKDSQANLKKQVSDRDAIIESLRNSVESIEKHSSEMENKNEHLVVDLKIMQNSNKRLKEQFDNYKQANYIALQIINSYLKSTSVQVDTINLDQKCNDKINSIFKSLAQRNKDIHKQLVQKSDKIAQLQKQLQCLIEERDLKEQGLLAAGHHLELLKKNTNQYSDQITNKNIMIREVNEQLKLKEKEIQDIEAANSKKIFGLNTIISQKNRELVELKHHSDQLSESMQKLTLQLKNTNAELKKIQKDKKTIQYDQKSKLSMVDTNLRTQMERVNALEADKSFLEKQLRQEKDNLRKVMRQLQNKCYQFQDLQLRLEEHNSIDSFKQSELKRLKQINSEFKFLFDLLFSLDFTSFDKNNILNDKVEKYLNEPASRQSQIFKQKMRSYYDNLTIFMSKHLDLLETFRDLTGQYQHFKSEAGRQQIAQNKVLTEFQIKLQDIEKIREKQNQSKMDLLKSYDEQKVSADVLRRFVDELIKLLNTMQKEKKVSVFVISPVKELIKKIEEYCLHIHKNIATCINKNKREWDLANIRAKKNNSKKEETVSPNIRP